MKTCSAWNPLRLALCVTICFLITPAVFPQTVGVPGVAQASNATCQWQSTLIPNPPTGIANTKSDILFNAFKSNPAFNFGQLALNLDLIHIGVDQYFAWVNVQPAMTCGAISRPAKDLGEEVGG